MRTAITIGGLLLALGLSAQQDLFRSRIALRGGLVRSLGDISSSYSDANWERSAMMALDYELFLGYGASLRIGASHQRISGYDILTDRHDRGLNFLARANTAELGFKFQFDNGRLMRYDARFAPFLAIGVGYGQYSVYGDLYTADGGRYHHWSDGTLRDGPEGSAANIIEADGDFETELTDLATEDGKSAAPNFFFIPASVGLKWRISDRMAAELAYNFNWTFTDRLDDVHDQYAVTTDPALAYASNPTGRIGDRGDAGTDDHFHSVSVGLAYYFGRRSSRYTMTPLYVDDRSVPPPPAMVPPAPKSEPVAPKPVEEHTVIINVESIRVGTLIVDSLVVTGRSMAKDTTLVKADTLVMKADSTAAVIVDSLRNSTMIVVDSAAALVKSDTLLLEADSVISTPKVDTLHVSAPDSMSKVVVPVVPDTLLKHRADTIRTTIGTLPTDSTIKAVRDTIMAPAPKRYGAKDTVQPPPIIVPDTVIRNVPAPVVPATPAPKTEPATPVEPATPKSSTPPPAPEPRSGSSTPVTVPQTTTTTQTAQPPVVHQEKKSTVVPVVVPIITGDDDSKKKRELKDENERLQAELDEARSQRGVDTVVVSRTDTLLKSQVDTVLRTVALSTPVDHNDSIARMNALLNERITALEAYIAQQNDSTRAASSDSLRQRIKDLDAETAALRAKLNTKPAQATTPAATTPKAETVIMDTLSFAVGTSSMGPEQRLQLGRLAERISRTKGKVLITGHTDASGPATLNLRLSQQRAEAVAEALKTAGVPAERMIVRGLGEQLAKREVDPSERVVLIQVNNAKE